MKKFIAIVSGLLLGAVVSVTAQEVLSDMAARIANPAVVQDQSKLPNQDNRSGYLSVLVNVAVDGGSGSVDVGPVLPAGTAVVGGYAHVIAPFLPAAAATNTAFTIQAAADLKAVTTSLANAGLVALKPSISTVTITATSATPVVVSSSPIVVTGDNSRVTFVYGSAATSGVALLHLDLIKVQ
jgi:hypothetical protein